MLHGPDARLEAEHNTLFQPNIAADLIHKTAQAADGSGCGASRAARPAQKILHYAISR